jgi:hypothetical protein
MPFYFRAVTALFPSSAAPNQLPAEGTEMPPAPDCPVDTNGDYTVKWTYTGPANLRFRVQEATQSQSIFFDNADEPLMPNVIGTTAVTENSRWRDSGIAGTPQTPPMWTSAVNPDTSTLAYFIPGAAGQNHSLTMKNTIALPATGITLSFRTRVSLDNNFDFGFVEVTTDNANYFPVLTLTGTFNGTREIDLSAYSGQTIRLRFRLLTPQGASASPGAGWHVENIQINSDDFRTIAEPASGQTSLNINNRAYGTYLYRIAALYANPNPLDPGTTITGPYSNIRCVRVIQGTPPAQLQSVVSRKTHGSISTPFDVPLPTTGVPGVECRTGGVDGDHRMIFTFAEPVTSVGSTNAAATNSSPSASGAVGPNANQYTVNLSGVPNDQYVTVTLDGVQTGAANLNNVQGTMGVLLGDTTNNGAVNSSDVTQTKSRSGQTADASNFRSDVTINGPINSSDITTVKANSGTVLP